MTKFTQNKKLFYNKKRGKLCKKQLLPKKRGRPCKKQLDKNSNLINPNKSFENNQNKTLINSIFGSKIISSIIMNNYNSCKYYVGILDGIEHNTSKTLISIGMDKKSILLVESNNVLASAHKNDNFTRSSTFFR